MYFWIKLKPILSNASCFCKKYESCAQTLSRLQRNNVCFIQNFLVSFGSKSNDNNNSNDGAAKVKAYTNELTVLKYGRNQSLHDALPSYLMYSNVNLK
jgi:hypothetical protein